jgi:rare lipoprotein A (peptidoglycan hydrolase)
VIDDPMTSVRFRVPGFRSPRAGATLLALLMVALPTGAHEIKGWWKHDPSFWRHDFRAHPELRRVHRHWHEGHRRPKRAGPRLERWKRRHGRMHHLRLNHPHQASHFHRSIARQAGQASWYDLEGDMGSCGEPLHGAYAAHPTWPCGTLVSVRTEDRYVFVRVMDRGPSLDGRVIDLARRAFERLAPSSEGLVDVKLYRLEP